MHVARRGVAVGGACRRPRCARRSPGCRRRRPSPRSPRSAACRRASSPPKPYGETGSMNVSDATGRSIANARDRRAAGRPADEVRRRRDPERVQQRRGVVGPVAQPAGGVDRQRLGVPEPAHVGREQPVARGRDVEEVLEEAAGREVAVQQHDRDPVLGPGLDHVASADGRVDARSASRETIQTMRVELSTPGPADEAEFLAAMRASRDAAPPVDLPAADARGLPRLPRAPRRAQGRLPRPPQRGRGDRRLAQRVRDRPRRARRRLPRLRRRRRAHRPGLHVRGARSSCCSEAFETLGLHRLEANIQPGNTGLDRARPARRIQARGLLPGLPEDRRRMARS